MTEKNRTSIYGANSEPPVHLPSKIPSQWIVCTLLPKLNQCVPYGPAIPLLCINVSVCVCVCVCVREREKNVCICPPSYVDTNVHILHNQKLETTQMSINSRMVKLQHSHKRVYSNEKEQATDKCNSMMGSHTYNMKLKKPDTKEYILNDSIYKKS